MEPSSVPEEAGCAFPQQGSKPSLSAWLGAMMQGQLALCAPTWIISVFLSPTALLLGGLSVSP